MKRAVSCFSMLGKPHVADENNLEAPLMLDATLESGVAVPRDHGGSAFIYQGYDNEEDGEVARRFDGRHLPLPPVIGKIRSYVAKYGWLSKQGLKRKNWKRRFFVLENLCLTYREKPEDPDPLGIVNLEGAAIRRSDIRRDRHCFEVFHNDRRTYYMFAESEEACVSWMRALKSNVKLEKDRRKGMREVEELQQELRALKSSISKAMRDLRHHKSTIEIQRLSMAEDDEKLMTLERRISSMQQQQMKTADVQTKITLSDLGYTHKKLQETTAELSTSKAQCKTLALEVKRLRQELKTTGKEKNLLSGEVKKLKELNEYQEKKFLELNIPLVKEKSEKIKRDLENIERIHEEASVNHSVTSSSDMYDEPTTNGFQQDAETSESETKEPARKIPTGMTPSTDIQHDFDIKTDFDFSDPNRSDSDTDLESEDKISSLPNTDFTEVSRMVSGSHLSRPLVNLSEGSNKNSRNNSGRSTPNTASPHLSPRSDGKPPPPPPSIPLKPPSVGNVAERDAWLKGLVPSKQSYKPPPPQKKTGFGSFFDFDIDIPSVDQIKQRFGVGKPPSPRRTAVSVTNGPIKGPNPFPYRHGPSVPAKLPSHENHTNQQPQQPTSGYVPPNQEYQNHQLQQEHSQTRVGNSPQSPPRSPKYQSPSSESTTPPNEPGQPPNDPQSPKRQPEKEQPAHRKENKQRKQSNLSPTSNQHFSPNHSNLDLNHYNQMTDEQEKPRKRSFLSMLRKKSFGRKVSSSSARPPFRSPPSSPPPPHKKSGQELGNMSPRPPTLSNISALGAETTSDDHDYHAFDDVKSVTSIMSEDEIGADLNDSRTKRSSRFTASFNEDGFVQLDGVPKTEWK